jgi:hypothetical protein
MRTRWVALLPPDKILSAMPALRCSISKGNMHCKICQSQMTVSFHATVLNRHEVTYWLCNGCGLLASEQPYWLQEAYADAIAASDTGLVARNMAISRRLAVLIFAVFGPHGHYVDMAGGTGLLVRLMRDIGFDFWWHDPYCQNVHAKGFEFSSSEQPCAAVTAFEVLEHLEDPLDFIRKTLALCHSDTLIFSSELFEGEPPRPGKWWYYSFETGQHIAFFQRRTLAKLGAILGLRLYSSSGMHMLSGRNLSDAKFQAATGSLHRLAWPAVRRLMSSRTIKDHELMRRHAPQIPNEALSTHSSDFNE